MATLLDDVFGEMRGKMAESLAQSFGDNADALVQVYNKYKTPTEPTLYDINNSEHLIELVKEGMSAKDISGLVITGASYVRKSTTGSIESLPIEGLKSIVTSKAGLMLVELIKNPQSNPTLYALCVSSILGPYFETLAKQ